MFIVWTLHYIHQPNSQLSHNVSVGAYYFFKVLTTVQLRYFPISISPSLGFCWTKLLSVGNVKHQFTWVRKMLVHWWVTLPEFQLLLNWSGLFQVNSFYTVATGPASYKSQRGRGWSHQYPLSLDFPHLFHLAFISSLALQGEDFPTSKLDYFGFSHWLITRRQSSFGATFKLLLWTRNCSFSVSLFLKVSFYLMMPDH